MKNIYKPLLIVVFLAGFVFLLFFSLHGRLPTLLDPKGIIASKERGLMRDATLLMLLVVIPVYALTFFIAWRYRASNTKAVHTPEWEHKRASELIWWGVPCAIILVLAVITWTSTHKLDPYRPLASDVKPLTIQAVALDWKWLFIYPEQNIATVNFMEIPDQTPINLQITADAPMNSIWIPKLGGQIYAMPGMSTQLHLMADKPGTYEGRSANFSGVGFARMKFTTQSGSEEDFRRWMESVRRSPDILDANTYHDLAMPSVDNPVAYYASVKDGLFDSIVMKYKVPSDGFDEHG
jgi:cytochrome o ubiquinol oxidase subunit II